MLESELGLKKVEGGRLVTLPSDVLFDFDQATIRPDAARTLARVARLLDHYKPASVEVTGHTDNKGSDDYNLKLSQRRADSVTAYLNTKHGFASKLFTAAAAGESQPVAPNQNADGSDNPAGRQKNRRVAILMRD